MELKCLFGHKWKHGCCCINCGTTRHKWSEDCKCSRCGRQHDWQWDGINCYEKCSLCGIHRVGEREHHKWNTVENRYLEGCKCTVCGAINDSYRADHKYKKIVNSCALSCSICGKIFEDRNHDWNHCKCRKCSKTRDKDGSSDFHEWNHCVCRICGEKRDYKFLYGRKTDSHDWNHCVCRICEKTRDNDHDWVSQGCTKVCSVCGKEITNYDEKAHYWEMFAKCKKKCKQCGLIQDNHSFKTRTGSYSFIEYDNGWPNRIDVTVTTYTCTVCGYEKQL